MLNVSKITLTLFFCSFITSLYAQQIKDGETLDLNGLGVTYRITNKETVTVSGSEFDKYKVEASLKNNTDKSINNRLSSYPDPQSITGGRIAELNCTNATGAKLTSKKLELNMNTHNVKVTYMTRDKDGKLVNSIITIPAGFYLDPGQTIQNSVTFIVPKGETPQVSVHLVK